VYEGNHGDSAGQIGPRPNGLITVSQKEYYEEEQEAKPDDAEASRSKVRMQHDKQ